MANERYYSPGTPGQETFAATAPVRAVEVVEIDKNLPWVVTIDSGPAIIPSVQPDDDNLRFNHIAIRNPALIDYVIDRSKPALIVVNLDSTIKSVGELVKFAPVVVVIDRNGSAVNRVEEIYKEGAKVVLDKASDPRIINAAIQEVFRGTLISPDDEPISGLDSGNSEEVAQEKPVLSIGGLEVNVGKAEIKYNGEVIDLTEKERRILYLLIEKIDTVVSKPTIVERVWEHPIDEHIESSLRVHIHKLRAKIPGFIKTKVNAGYIFMSPKDGTIEDAAPEENGSKKNRSFHLLSS